MTAAAGRQIPRLLPYYLTQGLLLAALASVIALLGDIRDEFGLSETRIGLIIGAGFFTAFVSQLTLSRLADRGHGPAMVRIGMVVAAASMVGFAFGDTFIEFLIARALLGLAVGVAQPAVRRTVILAEPAHAGRNIGRLGVAEVLGFALGPAVAALIAEFTSLDVPFFVVAAVILATLLSMGTLAADESAQSTHRENPLVLLGDRRVLGTLLLVASEFLLIGGYEAVWAVMLTDQGAATWQIGVGFTIFALPIGALAPFAGAWAQRTGGLALSAGGLGLSAVLAIPLGFVDSVWGLTAIAFFAAIGSGIGFPAGLFLFSRVVADDRQAGAQGLFGATEVLFGGIAAVIAARIYDTSGQMLVWIVMPGIMLAMLVLGLALRRGTAVSSLARS